MIIDRSVYPDIDPPDVLSSPEERADYLHRICAAFDFGVFPEQADWTTFAGWRDIFDRFPLPDSPGYHAFRHWYGWLAVPVQRRLGVPPWKVADLHDGRVDPCEEIAKGAKSIASAALEVDAKDDAARPFYATFGFLSLTDDRLHMELPMETARDQNLKDEKHPASPGLVEGTCF